MTGVQNIGNVLRNRKISRQKACCLRLTNKKTLQHEFDNNKWKNTAGRCDY